MGSIFGHTPGSDQEEWISISDLMTGLMVVFLFVSIAYTVRVQEQNNQIRRDAERLESQNSRIRGIADALISNENEIHEALLQEFSAQEQKEWGMRLINEDQDRLVVRFVNTRNTEHEPINRAVETIEPRVFFKQQEDEISEEYKEILRMFFPRYIAVLSKYRSVISEVRIEGHTSSEWRNESELKRYLNNMELSQSRARAVLQHVLELQEEGSVDKWPFSHLTANGLSFSKLITDSEGTEMEELSRRVEFRVLTTARAEIEKIWTEEQ